MIELQILSKVLNEGNTSLLELNGITEEYFNVYADEYSYIMEHKRNYGNIPDKETFINKFRDFSIIEVQEPDKYLIDTINEEHLYSKTVPVITKIAEIIQTDARAAVEYLQSQLASLQVNSCVTGIDIISTANKRLQEWEDRKMNPDDYSIPTGFEELDEITGGWQMGEELAVILARTGQGKSWILIKTLEHAWKNNKVVGLLEPEMTANKTGYRFDTLHANHSNRSLMRGEEVANYDNYIAELQKGTVPFYVAHPKDFNRKVTIAKLRSWVKTNNIDVLAIDGISYLTDERYIRGDNRTTGLTNISEDLMDLSIELKIPVIVVVQSNRDGAKVKDSAPNIENIRDSDGIAFNASTIISVIQKGPGVELVVGKNRNGESDLSVLYYWDIDKGIFRYVPHEEGSIDDTERIDEVRSSYVDGTDVF